MSARQSVQINDGQDTATGSTVDAAGASTVVGQLKSIAGAGTPTVSKATPGTTSGTVLAANAARIAATLVNDGLVKVYLDFGGAATTDDFPLDAGQGLAIAGYTGSITGITASGTGDIRVIETAGS